MTTEHKRQYQRVDFAANWFALNPVLALGELGIEKESLRVKVGDGATPWNGLSFIEGLQAANNLSDVSNPATALANLGTAPIVTPAQFGAKGDGTTDDSAAIQAALNAATGSICLLGPYTYNIGTATLNVPQKTTLAGRGRGVSIITSAGPNAAIQMANRSTAEQKLNVQIFDLTVNAPNSTTGINCKGMTRGRIERVEVIGVPTTTAPTSGTVGILLDGSYGGAIGCWWNVIRDCYISGWDSGVKLTGVVAGGQANENQVTNCRIAWTNRGVWVDVGDHNTIRECDVSSSVAGCVGVYANDWGTRVLACRFEGVAVGVEVGPQAKQVEIGSLNAFDSQAAGAIGVQLDAGSKDTRIGSNDYWTLTSPIVDNTANDSTGTSCSYFNKALLVPLVFAKASLPAGFSGVVNLLGATANAVASMGRGYQIRGCVAKLSSQVTAGTCKVQPGVSGTPSTTLQPTIAAGSNIAIDWQAMGKDTNTAGTTGIACKVTTSADFAPAGSAELIVTVWVEFLP